MDVVKKAYISDDQTRRYILWRTWGSGPIAIFVLLNPSTADAEVDDPTTRKCMAYARRWGMSGIAIVNMFSRRATDPKALMDGKPVGGTTADWNLSWWELRKHTQKDGNIVVCGWGSHPLVPYFQHGLIDLILALGFTPMALRVNKDGTPGHPLYLKGTAPLIPYPRPARE